MFFNDSLNTSDTSNQSSIFSTNCFEDISSIQLLPPQTTPTNSFKSTQNFPENRRYSLPPTHTPEMLSLYQENLILKQKIQNLQNSLKHNSSNSCQELESFFSPIQTDSWLKSDTQFFDDGNNDSCIKSLSEEFSAALESGAIKRRRDSGFEKEPKKFIKLAIMKSIGTLKF